MEDKMILKKKIAEKPVIFEPLTQILFSVTSLVGRKARLSWGYDIKNYKVKTLLEH